MSAEHAEQRDILRRIAERGLTLAQKGRAPCFNSEDEARAEAHCEHIDLWQHMLNELQRVKP